MGTLVYRGITIEDVFNVCVRGGYVVVDGNRNFDLSLKQNDRVQVHLIKGTIKNLVSGNCAYVNGNVLSTLDCGNCAYVSGKVGNVVGRGRTEHASYLNSHMKQSLENYNKRIAGENKRKIIKLYGNFNQVHVDQLGSVEVLIDGDLNFAKVSNCAYVKGSVPTVNVGNCCIMGRL